MQTASNVQLCLTVCAFCPFIHFTGSIIGNLFVKQSIKKVAMSTHNVDFVHFIVYVRHYVYTLYFV